MRTYDAEAIFGTHTLLRGPYVGVVTRSALAAHAPNGAPILRVLDMEWLLVGSGWAGGGASPRPAHLSVEEAMEESTYLRLLGSVARSTALYFSVEYDLTNSVQRADAIARGAGVADTPAPDAPLAPLGLREDWWATADERFQFNRVAARDFAAMPGGTSFSAPFISGFVGASQGPLDLGGTGSDAPASLLLISRRGVKRQGMRFLVRGADTAGNVANFAETEQVLTWRSGSLSSYTQVRGSIPVLWDQPPTCKYTPKILLRGGATTADSQRASIPAFTLHALALKRAYGRVTAVNLIDQKSDQLRLGTLFAEVTRNAPHLPQGLAAGDWALTWFDFHKECKAMKWENLAKLFEKTEVASALRDDSFFFAPAAGDARLRSSQTGVIRTNCIDNLDRTNVVQSVFARSRALAAVPGAAEKASQARSSVLTSPFPLFETAFNALWADNADALSRLYSGTGALKTDFTRTGKRTFRGLIADGVNSITRYVLNNFADGRMQDALDLFLGRFVPERARGGGPARGASSRVLAHLASTTPRRVLGRTLLLWAAVTFTLAAMGRLRGGETNARSIAWAGLGAGVLVSGLAGVLMSKGMPAALGRALVCRPAFVDDAQEKSKSP